MEKLLNFIAVKKNLITQEGNEIRFFQKLDLNINDDSYNKMLNELENSYINKFKKRNDIYIVLKSLENDTKIDYYNKKYGLKFRNTKLKNDGYSCSKLELKTMINKENEVEYWVKVEDNFNESKVFSSDLTINMNQLSEFINVMIKSLRSQEQYYNFLNEAIEYLEIVSNTFLGNTNYSIMLVIVDKAVDKVNQSYEITYIKNEVYEIEVNKKNSVAKLYYKEFCFTSCVEGFLVENYNKMLEKLKKINEKDKFFLGYPEYLHSLIK